MNAITNRIARGITRPSAFEEAMPGWNGEESIMAYVIRTRKQREAAAAAKAKRVREWLMFANLIVWPLAGLAAVAFVERAIPW